MSPALSTVGRWIGHGLRWPLRLSYPALVLVALAAAWCLVTGVIDLRILFDALGGGIVGTAGIAAGLVLLPFVFGWAPWYALSSWGEWLPMATSCVGYVAVILIAVRLRRVRRRGAGPGARGE